MAQDWDALGIGLVQPNWSCLQIDYSHPYWP